MILFSSHGELATRLPIDGRAAYQARDADDEGLLQDLARIGFVQRMNASASETGTSGTGWRWCGDHFASSRPLLALLARFDLHLEVELAADEAVWIAAAIESSAATDARQAFSGTGFRPDRAVRACLGEFAEFQSWLYRLGDADTHCDQRMLVERAIDPWSVLGFALPQRDRRLELNDAWLGYESIPTMDAFAGEIDWTAAYALGDGSTYWLPSQLCFGQYGARAKCADPTWRSDSNGCAAGTTREKALAHALLELVERDATGIWWYGRVRRPAVPREHLEGDPLSLALKARERLGQRVLLLDLTHDLEIPVVAAILAGADGDLLALGFGCDLEPARAIRSAYREMCQMEFSIAFAKHRVALAGEAARAEDRRLLAWLADASTLPHLQPDEQLAGRASSNDAINDAQTIERVHDRLRRAGLQTYVVDLERPDIGVPAVRAFVPGLCHYKPRLGFTRLVEVPRALGWRSASFGPQDLSTLPLLI